MIPHPLRCETCEWEQCTKGRHWSDPEYIKWKNCPYKNDEAKRRDLKEEMRLPESAWAFTSIVGCASHSSTTGTEIEDI